MFRGLSAVNLDAKGRLAIPMKYRQMLVDLCAGRLVATIDTEERCLLIYPLHEWEVIQAKIEALPSFNPSARRIQRLLIGHATDIDVDANGRILLSQPLREYAQLEKETILLGQGKKLELWSKDLWNSRRDDYIAEVNAPEVLPDELLNLSL
ncbi:MAG: division/cell wall cluster transcriptional repressor MraZ [Oleispira antarctica]|uniref:Transcriptional regulator MraZ n=1 Tax=Oleispira antarctica RB-8 TaxID=698738 RepID=R4YQ26_OLEAN|nr:division/cell wall cluster transcriptional repressor MraZ [Oleispira antarctica]MBQ0792657.1 division/cell wall cluster transcriptional repressor MraZ [Oleispira antarctica]CCK77192.1 Protein MraZ [Oleispira antarctica RB-8]